MSNLEFMEVDLSELAIEGLEDCFFALEILAGAAQVIRNTYPGENIWPLWLMEE